MEIIIISITAILVENFVLVKFLGICPFLGVSRKIPTALGMGMAVVFVMSVSSVITWLVDTYILINLNLEYMRTIAFILVIASLVQIVELFMKKFSKPLHSALGIYLPLITTNCAVLGVTLLNSEHKYNLIQSLVYSASAAVGFTVALVLIAGIRERLETANVPEPLQDVPITLISAGLMAIAFMGFSGLKL